MVDDETNIPFLTKDVTFSWTELKARSGDPLMQARALHQAWKAAGWWTRLRYRITQRRWKPESYTEFFAWKMDQRMLHGGVD